MNDEEVLSLSRNHCSAGRLEPAVTPPAVTRSQLSTWAFLRPGPTSLRRLRRVPPEFDALFAAARTWDTLTSVSLPLPWSANGSAFLGRLNIRVF
jgi:hypothetical protein